MFKRTGAGRVVRVGEPNPGSDSEAPYTLVVVKVTPNQANAVAVGDVAVFVRKK